MPSLEHESIAVLFRNRPSLAGEILRQVLGVAVPDYDKARVESSDLTEWNPAEFRADVVTVYESDSPVMAMIVEVQRGRDPDKRWSWPAYVAGLCARMRCATLLLVICPDRTVGEWCAQPIELGHPGLTLKPLVLPPHRIPVVTDEREAAASPELAVLSAMAHGTEAGRHRIFRALLSAVGVMDDDDQADLYIDIVLMTLPAAPARELEDMMASGTYPYKSDFARRHFARGQSRR